MHLLKFFFVFVAENCEHFCRVNFRFLASKES